MDAKFQAPHDVTYHKM